MTSDASGAFQTTTSFDDFSVFVCSTDKDDGTGRPQFPKARTNFTSPYIEASVDGDTVKLVLTLLPTDNLVFQLVDARSSRPVGNAAVFFKDDEESSDDYQSTPPWRLYQVLKMGSTDFRGRKPVALESTKLLVLATGYQPLLLKLSETFARRRAIEKRLELTPLPHLELTVVTPDGKPAAGSVFETIRPNESLYREEFGELHQFKLQIKHLLDLSVTTDNKGFVQIEYPALGKSVSYRLRHSTGYSELSVRNLKPAGDTAIQQHIELHRYVTIRGKYLPRIGPNENLELYRLPEDRLAAVDLGTPVPVDQQGNFEIRKLTAGWYCLVHHIYYGGRDGRGNSVALVGFERFRVAHGQVVELTLGTQGRAVRGRLKLPHGFRFEDHRFELSIDPDIKRPDYPTSPRNITDEQSLIRWWDAYWDSDTGRRFSDCWVRNMHTVAANDGTFYLPFVRPGTYRISRVSTSYNLNSPLELPRTEFTIPDDGNQQPFDLGDIRIIEK